MTPGVGQVVHYVSHGTPPREDGSQAYPSACRAAIITEVSDEQTVSLCVLNPTGQFFNQGVPYDEWDGTQALPGAAPQGGSWHWPERTGP